MFHRKHYLGCLFLLILSKSVPAKKIKMDSPVNGTGFPLGPEGGKG
jgi:hypothetical protein